MVPRRHHPRRSPAPAPRTRGDGPDTRSNVDPNTNCSPHPRGWPHLGRFASPVRRLLPAPAGMAPRSPPAPRARRSAPRTRGDGPSSAFASSSAIRCSPHPRGWPDCCAKWQDQPSLLPAPAGMAPAAPRTAPRRPSAPRTRGDGPWFRTRSWCPLSCSPHPRGWPQLVGLAAVGDSLLTAPAGMAPNAPRTNGAPVTAPRTRGDGPCSHEVTLTGVDCSPHPRGWPRPPCRSRPPARLLPAPAGMAPPPVSHPSGSSCSPHPRGWPLGQDHDDAHGLLLPAPAGMAPTGTRSGSCSRTAPRTRGHGPTKLASRLACVVGVSDSDTAFVTGLGTDGRR